ncbi:MAG TPA: M90 family metallopeptidase [Anaerolineales bacterium]|nr:M90 family metallopeptidase [Anaerolineales bacterium]
MLSRLGWARSRRKRKPLPPSVLAVLESRVAYYRLLPPSEQQELRGMLQVLLGEVSFEPGAGLERVEDEMRILIAAQASVLLLHRPLRDLPDLRTVIVYPGVYQARERLHTDEGVEFEADEERFGEAWAHGVLLFSWEDVVYDAEHIDDAQNIVFHEVAHTLDEQNRAAEGIPLLLDGDLGSRWEPIFGSAFEQHQRAVRRRRRTRLDEYGAEDRAEFFAVATEAFLEDAVAFRGAYPQLYDLLRDFYHLDPAAFA